MNIDAGLSIVVSFLCFAWIFAKKVYPLLTKALDEHIDSVKKQILDAEKMKEEASRALKIAYVKRQEVAGAIEENRKLSEARIAQLKKENKEYIEQLRARYESSLKASLEAEFAKQKGELLDKLADLVIQKLSEQVKQADCKVSTIVTEDDLKKLM
ncbi:MAG: ATP synthase F0 subunit B [Alphaproteobacteria bacterium]|nr:ATP synthase F0 subunit B [Alphaproteobacteria bacterium]